MPSIVSRADHLGRRIAAQCIGIALTVWRGAYVCGGCDSPRERIGPLSASCCEEAPDYSFPWVWVEDAIPLEVEISWDTWTDADGRHTDGPRARVTLEESTSHFLGPENLGGPVELRVDPGGTTMSLGFGRRSYRSTVRLHAPMILTAAELAEAERQMHEHPDWSNDHE